MPENFLLPLQRTEDLFKILQARFDKNKYRLEGLHWADIHTRLDAKPEKVWSLNEMEETGGEPAVVGQDPATGDYLFYDCSAESPIGRRSICYDPEALAARKAHKPKHCATGMAAEMGIELLTEEQYRTLQQFGKFDTKTSSWLATPPAIRGLGGSLFGDFRYGTVFVYHNGAESYYAGRGFRGLLRV